jgi:membrane protein DedA with SNARE-associated domain
MDSILSFIQSNVQYAPYMVFGLVLLGGLNLPVSEDALIFISAVLAFEYPRYSIPLFLGIYLGAYFSAWICYGIGRFLGEKLNHYKFFKKLAKPQKIAKIQKYLLKYGIFTFIIVRFIPFGARNALFLTAGISKMPFFRFILTDLPACTLAISSYFYLYYRYGEKVIESVKKGNTFLGIIVLFACLYFILKKYHVAKTKG